jgi:nucleoside-diphosphate-sugar epimerase
VTHGRVLLVTGAAGLVGRGIVERALADDRFARVFALVRRQSTVPPPPRVRFLVGDVARPDLGLDGDTWASLAGEVTDVVHAAADTRFNRPLDEVRRTNVDGTRNALDLAERCPRLERFLHVSSVHACGLTPGAVPERPLSPPPEFANTYQRSKCEAETVVLERATSLPASIVRLTTLIGDSRTGEVLRPNYVHGLIRLLPMRLCPVAAVDPVATVDVLASDWALDALHAVLARAFRPGEVYQVSAGARSLTVATLHEEIARAFAEHGDADFRLPRTVSLDEYRAHVDAIGRSGNRTSARLLGALELFLPHLRIRQRFENERTNRLLEGLLPPPPSPLETFRRVIRWCLRTEYGARAETTTPTVAQSLSA